MTLLELTVVILVLLSLITVIFVGINAWKRGSDRSQSIVTMRNAQLAVRGEQNTRGLNASSPGNVVTISNLQDLVFGINPDAYINVENVGDVPDHPAPGVNFSITRGNGAEIPEIGEPYISSGNPTYDPDSTVGW